MVRLAHKYGIKSVGVADYAFSNRDFDNQSLRFEPERANRYMAEAKKVADQLDVVLDLPPLYEPEPPPSRSTSLWQKIKKVKGIFPVPKRFPQRIHRVALRELRMLHHLRTLLDLKVPPGNRLESLKGDRKGQYSIRVNDQFRVCFTWRSGDAFEVEIVDYH